MSSSDSIISAFMKTTTLPIYYKDSSMYDDMLNGLKEYVAYSMAFGRHAFMRITYIFVHIPIILEIIIIIAQDNNQRNQ